MCVFCLYIMYILKLEVRTLVNHLWVLGIEPRSSARTSTLTISPPSTPILFRFIFISCVLHMNVLPVCTCVYCVCVCTVWGG